MTVAELKEILYQSCVPDSAEIFVCTSGTPSFVGDFLLSFDDPHKGLNYMSFQPSGYSPCQRVTAILLLEE